MHTSQRQHFPTGYLQYTRLYPWLETIFSLDIRGSVICSLFCCSFFYRGRRMVEFCPNLIFLVPTPAIQGTTLFECPPPPSQSEHKCDEKNCCSIAIGQSNSSLSRWPHLFEANISACPLSPLKFNQPNTCYKNEWLLWQEILLHIVHGYWQPHAWASNPVMD